MGRIEPAFNKWGWRLWALLEQVVEEVDWIREIDETVVVGIGCTRAAGGWDIEKNDPQEREGIRDVDPAVEVHVSPKEETRDRGERAEVNLVRTHVSDT